jgi:hypothetical protein
VRHYSLGNLLILNNLPSHCSNKETYQFIDFGLRIIAFVILQQQQQQQQQDSIELKS